MKSSHDSFIKVSHPCSKFNDLIDQPHPYPFRVLGARGALITNANFYGQSVCVWSLCVSGRAGLPAPPQGKLFYYPFLTFKRAHKFYDRPNPSPTNLTIQPWRERGARKVHYKISVANKTDNEKMNLLSL